MPWKSESIGICRRKIKSGNFFFHLNMSTTITFKVKIWLIWNLNSFKLNFFFGGGGCKGGGQGLILLWVKYKLPLHVFKFLYKTLYFFFLWSIACHWVCFWRSNEFLSSIYWIYPWAWQGEIKEICVMLHLELSNLVNGLNLFFFF